MSVSGQQQLQLLQQELQNELTSSNQLLRLISIELQKIKQFTSGGEEFENTIVQNASLIEKLSNIQKIDLNKPSITGHCE